MTGYHCCCGGGRDRPGGDSVGGADSPIFSAGRGVHSCGFRGCCVGKNRFRLF